MELWTEKYRPRRLSEVIDQKHVVDKLKVWSKEGSIPNMLFAGPAGVGKTTIALALAHELFGENWKQNFLELNASDDRGINVVRGRIKDFARVKSFGSEFKIIFLDESDALTPEAQQALRRTMERFSGVCRFVLSCVTPDTKILLPEEVEMEIGEFMKMYENKQANAVSTVDIKNKKISGNQVLCTIKMDPQITGKQVFEIMTMTGRKLKVTEDHPILTDNGWKNAGDLNIDDKIVIYPHLEGMEYENNGRNVFEPESFAKFLQSREKNSLYKSISKAKRFCELDSLSKRIIIEKVRELGKVVKSRSELTKREYDLYKIIKRFRRPVQRKEIQDRVGLSRIRTVQLLREIRERGFIKCYSDEFDKRIIYFKGTGRKPTTLRNSMDIKKAIKRRYNIDMSFCEIRKLLREGESPRTGVDKTLDGLGQKGLLDLKYNSKEIGAFARVFAFIYGDGHITKNNKTIIFTGNSEALEEVKKDLSILGYKGLPVTTKTLINTIRGREFEGHTTSFRLNSSELAKLLVFLGAPAGDKVITPYKIPDWIMNGTSFVKREFLRSLYGCEGYSPKIKKMNFEALTLRMHKSRKHKGSMIYFLKQIKWLLKEFGIESYIKIRKLGNQRKDGHVTDSYELILKSDNETLFKFFSRIGYAYEREKDIKSRLSAEYLRHKNFALMKRKKKAGDVLLAVENSGMSKREVARINDCSIDFVLDRINGKPVHINRDFLTFNEWVNKFGFGNGFVLNEIIEIKEIDCRDVRDITCFENHNFIANGIVSHNCNYSSRIIDPIQSRCAVFRFKRLTEKGVGEYVSRIAKGEKLTVSEDAIHAIYEVSEGDLRKSTNILQAAATSGKITKESVYEISGQARPQDIRHMIDLAIAGKFPDARKKLYDLLIEQGLSGEDIIREMHKSIFDLSIPEIAKLELIEKIGEFEFRLNQGGSEDIQLEALLANFIRAGKK